MWKGENCAESIYDSMLDLSMKAQLILCIKSKLDLYLSLFAIQH